MKRNLNALKTLHPLFLGLSISTCTSNVTRVFWKAKIGFFLAERKNLICTFLVSSKIVAQPLFFIMIIAHH